MYHAIVIREYGGPDKLRFEPHAIAAPGPHEVTLRHSAIGVNFHDVYVRSGLYKTLKLPGVPGVEAVGTVAEIGQAVTDFAIGDRVAYITSNYGTYAEASTVSAENLIRLDERINDSTAAAVLIKGLTALMLLTKLRQMRAGEVCLVHAAAGGVGRLLSQWASYLGMFVIGTVGDETKIDMAKKAGCSEVILHTHEKFAEKVRVLTDGRGVDVVFDAIGQSTFRNSMDVLAYGGLLVNYGQASGSVSPIAPSLLAEKSNGLWRPILFHYLRSSDERQQMMAQLLGALTDNILKPEIAAIIPLKEAQAAHRLIESRRANGSIVLVP